MLQSFDCCLAEVLFCPKPGVDRDLDLVTSPDIPELSSEYSSDNSEKKIYMNYCYIFFVIYSLRIH